MFQLLGLIAGGIGIAWYVKKSKKAYEGKRHRILLFYLITRKLPQN